MDKNVYPIAAIRNRTTERFQKKRQVEFMPMDTGKRDTLASYHELCVLGPSENKNVFEFQAQLLFKSEKVRY